MMNVVNRAKAPTPRFFKMLRGIGLVLAATGSAIITAPVSLPASLMSVAGYLTVAGGVISAVSQVTVDDKSVTDKEEVVDE
ncbi:MAG TPA: hypothetical protein VK102_01105 [Sphingobacterium sp.]|nr:hypothetical protein [Sphingobacterium sp.]